MAVADVLPQLQIGSWGVDLGCHVAGLGKGHLKNEAATVV